MRLDHTDEIPTGFEFVGQAYGATTIGGMLVDFVEVYRSPDDVLLSRGGSADDASLHVEEFVYRDRRHRVNGPALRVFEHPLGDGPLHREEWWLHGMRHRSGGEPAVVLVMESESRTEQWWVNNRTSRLDGPAAREVDLRSGEVRERWAVGGRWVSRAGLATELATFAPRQLKHEITHSVFADLYRGEPDRTVDALLAGVHTAEGVHELLAGAPLDWVLAFEESQFRPEETMSS